MSRDAPLWAQPAERPALTIPDLGTRSASELVVLADAYLRAADAAGLGFGDRVLLHGTDVVTTVAAHVGLTRRGVRTVAVAAPGTARDVARVAADAGCAAVITACMPDGAVTTLEPVAEGAAVPDDAGADAVACRAAVVADVVGLTAGGIVTMLLPHLHSLSLELVCAALHSGRHVVHATGDAVAALAASREPSDIVATRTMLHRLATERPDALTSSPRVLALGPIERDGLRDRLRDAVGDDVLIEIVIGAGGLEALVAPVGSALGGFWSWARGTPHRPAILNGGSVITAGELYDRVVAVASALAEELTVGDTFVGALGDHADAVTTVLAAQRAGVHVALVAPDAAPAEIGHHVQASGARVVVTSGDTGAVRGDTAGAVRVVTVNELVGRAAGPGVEAPQAGGICAFTSGTTGLPRRVRAQSPRWTPQLRAAWDVATVARIGIAGPGRHLVTGRPHQLAALTTAVAALHAGQTLVPLSSWSPRAALEALDRHDVTTAFFVPSMFAGLLALPEGTRAAATPQSLVAVVHSTAACPVATKLAMLDWWGPVLFERYGAAEAAGTYATPAEWIARPGTVGKPFPGVVVRVLDENGSPLPPNEPGRVYVTDTGFEYGDGTLPFDRRAGLVSVGDIGYLDDDGWLFLVGRESDYISVGGAKFHPREVEEVLERHEYVAECAVVAMPHKRLGQVPVAYIVPAAGTPTDATAIANALRAYAAATLPVIRRPLRFRAIDEVPRNAAGKVLRRVLMARATDDEPRAAEGAPGA
jgi:long-chain acyl-CoA synthetase